MAEEKKENCCCGASKVTAAVVKIAAGVAVVAVGILAMINWWGDLLILVKGCVGPILVLVGLITIAIAKE